MYFRVTFKNKSETMVIASDMYEAKSIAQFNASQEAASLKRQMEACRKSQPIIANGLHEEFLGRVTVINVVEVI